jgi:TPR repeat protein
MRFVSIHEISRALIAFLLVLTVNPARADFYTAQVAYKKGDFAAAFNQFKEMAELGQSEAQYDLAAMYARGEGISQNSVYAHAWASLAAQNGEMKGKALASQLQPD